MNNPATYEPGDKVWLRGAIGRERVTVAYIRGDRIRVKLSDGRGRTVPLDRIAPTVRPSIIPPAIERRQPANDVERRHFAPQLKQLPARDRKYLDWLRGLPCAFCGQDAHRCEASHHGKHGHSTKPSDHDALPACRICHSRHHQKGSPAPWMDALTREERAAFFQMRAAQLRERWER